MDDAVLYVLAFPQHHAVKIGITCDLNERIRTLTLIWGAPEPAQSWIALGTRHEVRVAERALHRLFNKSRARCGQQGDGHTEMFANECAPVALRALVDVDMDPQPLVAGRYAYLQLLADMKAAHRVRCAWCGATRPASPDTNVCPHCGQSEPVT